jgi:hypothetical protein
MWIADLDALGALVSSNLSAIVQQRLCESKPAGHKPSFPVTSIDNWEELLDPPNSVAVVRAHGSWEACLAATAVSVSLGHQTILFQDHGCWSCGLKVLQQLERPRWVDSEPSSNQHACPVNTTTSHFQTRINEPDAPNG